MTFESETPSSFQNAFPDIILSLSSGRGAAGVAVIRLSGHGVHRLLQPFLQVSKPKFRYCHYTIFQSPAHGVIDKILAIFFKGPSSFTGEDSAELHCHGGTYVVTTIIGCLIQSGCRQSEPGEFTKRAYLNGKMDLSTAEGIKEIIDAHAKHQWQAARFLATGGLAKLIEELRNKIIKAMAYLEAQIDFPDEGDTQNLHLGIVKNLVDEVSWQINRLNDSYHTGRVCKQGFKVALVGEPNMGKSTMMNHFLRENRAIVTDIPGTTRDFIEETCMMHGHLIRLIDTAGLTETNDVVEKMGIASTRKILQEADLVLWLIAKDKITKSMQTPEELKKLAPKKILYVTTKSDLKGATWPMSDMAVSCQANAGVDELKQAIAAKVAAVVNKLPEDGFITSIRHKQALETAAVGIQRFHVALEDQHFEECLALELQTTARALGEIIGNIDNEDLLDKIFSDFCIGK